MKFKKMMKTHGKIALSAVIVSIFAVVSAYSYGNTHGKNEGEIAGINSVTDKVQRDYNKAQNKIDELYNENSSLQSEKDALEKASKEKKDDKKDDKKKKSRSSTSKRPASNSGNKSSGGSNSPSIPKKLKDGVYEGSSSGYSGDVKVKVTVSVGKIADIQVSHSETPEYYAKAQAVIGKILSAQNTQVDSVSGATITSNAIKSAVSKALANAGDNSGCGTSAVDITELNNLKLKNKELQDQSKKFEDNLKKLQAELDKANSEGGGKLKDGEFEGEAQGYEGAIKVKVKVKKEKITSITVVSHTETAGYYEKGAEVIPKIIAAQNTKVDATSGATITGNGIKSAVNKALKKSRGDNSSDGADTAELENMKKKNEEQKTQIDDLNKQISGLQEQLSSNIGELTDGTFEGSGIGYNKTVPIKVKVVIKDKKIASVEVASHKEDKEYYKDFSLMYGKVIGKNNAKDVDVISHGTSSSHGIQAAINSALRKSASGNSSTDSDSEINKTLIENLRKQVSDLDSKNKELEKNVNSLNRTIEDKQREIDKLKHNSKYIDGTYSGLGKGYEDTDVTLDVVFKDDVIVAIQNEKLVDISGLNKIYIRKAKRIIPKIVEANSYNVDAIAGATYSSNGIKQAVEDALNKAKNPNYKEDTNDNPSKADDAKDHSDKQPSEKSIIDKLNKEIENLMKKVEGLNSKLAEKEKKIDEKDKELKEKDDRIKELEKQLQDKAK